MKRKIILLASFLFLAFFAKAQDEKFKALFIYNFTKYIEWPQSKQSGDFVIGIYGENPIQKELSVIAQKKRVGNQQISVKKITNIADAKSCNMVFVPQNKSADAKKIATSIKSSGVILITDKEGYAKSISGINFVKISGRQQFEVNKATIEAQGATVNSGLLTLGIVVN